MEAIKNLFVKIGRFLYALFFTRDDDLDLLQVLFVIITLLAIYLAYYVVVLTDSTDPVKLEAFVTLRWMLGLLIVTAVPKWIVPSIVAILTKKNNSTPRNSGPPRGFNRDEEIL